MDDSVSEFLMRFQSCFHLGPKSSQGLTRAGESNFKMAQPHGCWHASVSCGLLEWGPQFLASCWPEASLNSIPHEPLPGAAHSMAVIQEKVKNRATKMEAVVRFKNLLSKFTHCHFCFILFVRSESLSSSHT